MKNFVQRLKTRPLALLTVSIAAVTFGMAGSAMAGSATYNYSPVPGSASLVAPNPVLTLSDYLLSLPSDQIAEGPGSVAATLSAPLTIGINFEGSGSAQVNQNNSITSTALGSLFTQAQLTPGVVNLFGTGISGPNDGIGVLLSQVDDEKLTVATTGGNIFSTLTDFSSNSAVTLSGNQISATAGGNQISPNTTVIGPIALGYASATAGSIFNPVDPSTANTTVVSASTTIATDQFVTSAGPNTGSGASVAGGNVTLLMNESTAGQSVATNPTEDTNSILAQYVGNSVHNEFDAQSVGLDGSGNTVTGNTTYNGSVAVSSTQVNSETATTATPPLVAAGVTGSSITATIEDTAGAGAGTVFTGNLDLSDNSIATTATGNQVTSNEILFDPSLSIVGPSQTVPGVQNTLTQAGGTTNVALDGTLIVSSSQANNHTSFVADTDAAGITATLDSLSGTVTASGNTIASTAAGNQGVNLTSNAGGSAPIVALNGAGTANYQSNADTAISASNSIFSEVSVITGGTGVKPGSPTDTEAGAVVTASNNTLAVSASGSIYGTTTTALVGNVVQVVPNPTIDLQGTNFTDGSNAVASVSSNRAGGTGDTVLTTVGGITSSNLQFNDATSSVTALNDGPEVVVDDKSGNPTVSAGVAMDHSTVTVSDNQLSVQANGNEGNSGIALSGTNGTLSAALSNNQTNDAAVFATIDEAIITSSVEFTGAGNLTTFTLGNNTVSASAASNTANNEIDVSGFSNLTVGNTAASSFTLGGETISTTVSAATPRTATAAFTLLSDQVNGADSVLSANTNSTTPIISYVDGSFIDSVSTQSNNQFTTQAEGNSANNLLTLDTSNLRVANGVSDDQIAALSNIQDAGDGSVSAVLSNNTSVVFAGSIGFNGRGTEVLDSTVTLTDNTVSAFTAGNVANNTLAVTGTNHGFDAPVALSGLTFTDGGTATLGVQSAFALQNTQFDESGSRSTSITNGGVNAILESAVGGAPLVDADGSIFDDSSNTVIADTRGNYASNDLSLTGFATLQTSAGLQNYQLSQSAILAAIITGEDTVLVSGTTNGSTITLNSDTFNSKAIGNTAFNTLLIDPPTLTGGADLGDDPFVTFTAPATDNSYNIVADFTLGNVQSQTAAVAASTEATVNADLQAVNGNSVTVTGNAPSSLLPATLSSLAEGSDATNSLTIEATTANTVSGAVGSVQAKTEGVATDATTTSSGVGATATAVNGTQITVSDITASATAINNNATNSLTATATSSLQGTTSGAVAVAAIEPGATVPLITANADFPLFNLQQATGDGGSVLAATTMNGIIGLEATGLVAGGSVAVTDNTVSASASSNIANNSVALSGGATLSASSALVNSQANDDTVTGNVSTNVIGAAIGGTVTGVPVTVTGNAVISSADGNSASNSLSATAGGAIQDVATGVANGTIGTVPVTASATSDFSLFNQQTEAASGVVLSTVNLNGTIGLTTSSTVSGGTASVLNNSVEAEAAANIASNNVSLNGEASLSASSALVNSQSNAAPVTASVVGNSSTIGVTTTGSISGTPLNVTGNTVTALVNGNSASNTLSAQPTALYNVSTGATTAGTIAGGGTAQADYAVLNNQSNTGTGLAASITNVNIGVNNATPTVLGAPTVNGSTTSVLNNSAVASATGNNVSTVVALNSLPGNSPTVAATNIQFNSANVSATVSGVNIGINAGVGSSTTSTVSGNHIGAIAIGNSASVSIGFSH